MFAYPSDLLKVMVFTGKRGILWKKELGAGVVPVLLFLPILCAGYGWG
jgi:hypothetical protein